jgi:hypothetical protein
MAKQASSSARVADPVLGQTFIDVITGFKGVAMGRVAYLTGCNQILLSPRILKDGKRPDPEWFDEQRLVIDPKAKPIILDNGATPGCDKAAPIR